MKKFILFFLLFCYSTSGIAQYALIDSLVKEEMTKQHIAGLSLGIVKDGKAIVCKGYGFADLKDSTPVTTNTVFKIGSLSKQFIATAIMLLAEEGKLHLTDRMTQYFKDAPAGWDRITIRNLLNHTAGLERESPAFSWSKPQPDSVLIQASFKDKLLFPPGSKWEYSNLGYFVLADIIRKVSGQNFEDYMNHFFATSGLSHTTTTTKNSGSGKALGYRYKAETGEITGVPDIPVLRPSGAFSSSITDLIKWDSIQRNGKLLIRSDWSEMWEYTVKTEGEMRLLYNWEGYGYGWGAGNVQGHRLVAHGGYSPGFTCEYWKFPDDKISIIILTNREQNQKQEIFIDRIAKKIAAALIPDIKTAPVAPADLKKYTGIYSDKTSMKIKVTVSEKGLTAQATGQSSFPLEYMGKDKFRFEQGGIEIVFLPAKKEMILNQHGQNYLFVKDNQADLSPEN